MKRIVLSIVVLLLLLCGIAVAEEVTIVAEGDCGANVTWKLDSKGTLTISGEGEMRDYYNSNNVLTRTFEPFLPIVKLLADLLTNRNGDTCFIFDYS